MVAAASNLGRCSNKSRQTRDITVLNKIAAEIALYSGHSKETTREIMAFEKRQSELRALNDRTARRHQWEQFGLETPAADPRLGLQRTVKAAQYGAQARSGGYEQPRR